MKIDFSRLDALRPTVAVPEGFEPVPEAETPFDSGYEAMYRAARSRSSVSKWKSHAARYMAS